MQSSGLSSRATVRDVACNPLWLGFIIRVPWRIHRHRRAWFIRIRALINGLLILVIDSCDRIRWTSAISTSSTCAICGSRRETLDHILFIFPTPRRFDISWSGGWYRHVRSKVMWGFNGYLECGYITFGWRETKVGCASDALLLGLYRFYSIDVTYCIILDFCFPWLVHLGKFWHRYYLYIGTFV